MPLPRPGSRPGGAAAVRRIPEAEPTGKETLPELEQHEEKAPSLGAIPAAETVSAAPELGKPFTATRGAEASSAPWDDSDAAEEEITDVPAVPAERAQAAAALPMERPGTALPAVQGGVTGKLAEMGFDGLDLGSGFGAFPQVVLKDDMFSTSDGEKLGETFACIIHGSRPKWICKGHDGKGAPFKYTYDQVTDTQGRPLETHFEVWRAQGQMPGAPVFRAYLDVTAQLVDVTRRELGSVVILQVPQTSIERLKGYLTNLALQGANPSTVVTQVYLGQKVVSVAHPFWPWAFKKYATVDQMGI